MWRSLFLALGIVLCILGAECFVLEKAVLASDAPVAEQAASLFLTSQAPGNKEYVPPESAPWTLVTVGAVIIIYSHSIPRRNGG